MDILACMHIDMPSPGDAHSAVASNKTLKASQCLSTESSIGNRLAKHTIFILG